MLAVGGREVRLPEREVEAHLVDVFDAEHPERVLLVPPDHTRLHSGAGRITAFLYEHLTERGCDVWVLPALGTHVAMTAADLSSMFSDRVPADRVLEHRWTDGMARLGEVEAIPIEVDPVLVQPWDLVVSVGQVVPHEVIGMANFTKNLVIGLGGLPTINLTHYLGAQCGIENVIGRTETPARCRRRGVRSIRRRPNARDVGSDGDGVDCRRGRAARALRRTRTLGRIGRCRLPGRRRARGHVQHPPRRRAAPRGWCAGSIPLSSTAPGSATRPSTARGWRWPTGQSFVVLAPGDLVSARIRGSTPSSAATDPRHGGDDRRARGRSRARDQPRRRGTPGARQQRGPVRHRVLHRPRPRRVDPRGDRVGRLRGFGGRSRLSSLGSTAPVMRPSSSTSPRSACGRATIGCRSAPAAHVQGPRRRFELGADRSRPAHEDQQENPLRSADKGVGGCTPHAHDTEHRSSGWPRSTSHEKERGNLQQELVQHRRCRGSPRTLRSHAPSPRSWSRRPCPSHRGTDSSQRSLVRAPARARAREQ